MSSQTLVSFVMSVYKPNLDLLAKCIDSIKNQSYSNFELVLIYDGLDKEESKFLDNYLETFEKKKVIKNKKNLGLTKSLNIGVKNSKGELIARIDADDISSKDRIMLQVKEFTSDRSLGLLGTWFHVIHPNGERVKNQPPLAHNQLISEMFQRNPFCHSSVMFRKKLFDFVGGYDERYKVTQDLDLWFRISEVATIKVISTFLLDRYSLKDSISLKKTRWNQLFNSLKIRWKNLNLVDSKIEVVLKIIKAFIKGFILNLSPSLIENVRMYFRKISR